MGRIIYTDEEVQFANTRKEEIFRSNLDVACKVNRDQIYLLGMRFGDLMVDEFFQFVTINGVKESLWCCTCLRCGHSNIVMHEIRLLTGELTACALCDHNSYYRENDKKIYKHGYKPNPIHYVRWRIINE